MAASLGFGSATASGGSPGSDNILLVKYNAAGTALWAKIAASGSAGSAFRAVATAAGNVYAAGSFPPGTLNLGNSVIVSGGNPSGTNILLVKYDAANGAAQWAKTTVLASANSVFNAVAADGAGNIYAAGYQNGTGTLDFGNSITVSGGSSVLLVKYDAAGTAQWAKTVSGPNASFFSAVAVDGAGNVYAAGYQTGTGAFDYGNGVSADGAYTSTNALIVKYDADTGAAQWARTVGTATAVSRFDAVTVDGAGNVYAAGYQNDTQAFDYGSGYVYGNYTGQNAVIVKYNAAGAVLWARPALSAEPNASAFASVTADGAGNVYAAGSQTGAGAFDYGTAERPVTAAGAYSGGTNAALVKYPRE
jgi:hypothetical protein